MKATSLIIALLLLASCDSSRTNSDTVDTLMRSVKDLHESVTGTIAPTAKELQNAATSEVDKLFSIEYKVLELPSSTPGPDVERSLIDLGADRWNCFSVIPRPESILITCNRRPLSYLRYALRFFPVPLP